MNELKVQPVVGTTGGSTPYSYIAAASANQDSQVVKNGAGQVYEIVVSNVNASPRYLKLYDKATGPTSADTPAWRLLIPGNTAGSGLAKTIPDGLIFLNGISYRLTTGVADNDANAVAANEMLVNLGYK